MSLLPYEKRILEIFVESFPLSAHFTKNGRKLRKTGWGEIFPEIDKNVEQKEAFLTAVESLCSKGILTASWERFRKGDKLTALYLEDSEGMYNILGIEHPENTRQNILLRLNDYNPQNKLEEELLKFIINILKAKHPLSVEDKDKLFDILKLTSISRAFAKTFTLRALSIYLFNDSKRIERIIYNADRLTEKASAVKLSEHLGLKRTYPDVTFSGTCKIIFKNKEEWNLKEDLLILPLFMCMKIDKIVWFLWAGWAQKKVFLIY